MSASVLHVRSSIGLYGAEHVVLDLCDEQNRRSGASGIAAFSGTGPALPALLSAAQARGLRATAMPCRGAIDPHCVRQLRGLLTNGPAPVDVIHCHDYKSVVYGGLAAAGLPVARVATLHGWIPGGLRLRMYRWLELQMLRAFDRVCAVSATIEQDLLQSGLQRARVQQIDNGIDTARFRPVSPLLRSCRRHHLRIGCAARLSPEKNLLQLIEAVAVCRARGLPVRLIVLGEGPQRAELEQAVAAHGLQHAVQLPGARNGLEAWYPTLDAFVLPSLTEGMPMTVLEALACGCPVVASAVGAIPRLLDGLPDCRLVPAGDLDALTDALLALPLRRATVQPARRRIVERYSLARMAERYAAVYEEARAR